MEIARRMIDSGKLAVSSERDRTGNANISSSLGPYVTELRTKLQTERFSDDSPLPVNVPSSQQVNCFLRRYRKNMLTEAHRYEGQLSNVLTAVFFYAADSVRIALRIFMKHLILKKT